MPVDVMGNPADSIRSQGRRFRAGDLHLAFVADEEVAKKHAQRRNPDLKARLDATRSSVVEGVGAATSAWDAGECNRVLGQESTEEEKKLLRDLGPQRRKWSPMHGCISMSSSH